MEVTPTPLPDGGSAREGAAAAPDAAEAARMQAAATPARVRLPRNMAALASAEVSGRLLAFVTTIVAARVLGPGGFGPLGVALALVLYLSALGDGGLTLWTQRQIVLRPRELSRLVAGTLLVQFGLSVLVVVAIAVIAVAIPFEDQTDALLLAFSPYAVMQALNMIYVLQALERMVVVAVIRTLTQFVTALLAITLVVITEEALPVVLGMWIGLLAGDLVTLGILRGRYGVRLLDVRRFRREVGELLRAGAPFLASIALLFFVVSIDIVMVGAIENARVTGEYGAARRLIATPLQIIQVLLIAVFPEMVRRFADDRERFPDVVHNVLRLALRPTLAAAVFVLVEAEPIVELLLGTDYSGSADYLAITVLLIPLFWFYGLVGYALIAAGRQNAFLAILAATAAAAAVAYPVAILAFGAIGAAVVATGSVTAQALLFAYYGHRHLGLRAVTAVAWELPYGTVPLAGLILLHVAVPGPSLGLAFAAWVVALLAVEVANGVPTLRGARMLARPILARGAAP